MATVNIKWSKSDPVSIREYASACGFNLTAIDIRKLSADRKKWIESEVASWILYDLDEAYSQEHSKPLKDVTQGVYVISLADDLCTKYRQDHSQVLYIGRGEIRKRIKDHLKQWILNFSESLQDIRFHFWMAEIKIKGNKKGFCEVEADLLSYFYERHGGYPTLNKISGQMHRKQHVYENSSYVPFRNHQSVRSGWMITPMPENDWFRPLDD